MGPIVQIQKRSFKVDEFLLQNILVFLVYCFFIFLGFSRKNQKNRIKNYWMIMCKSCLIYEIILFYYYFWDFFYELKKSCTKNPAHFCTRNAKSSTLRAGKIHTQKSQMKNCKLIYFRMLFFPLLWTTDWLAPTGSLDRYYRTSSSSGYNAMHRKNFPKYSTLEWVTSFLMKIFIIYITFCIIKLNFYGEHFVQEKTQCFHGKHLGAQKFQLEICFGMCLTVTCVFLFVAKCLFFFHQLTTSSSFCPALQIVM